MSLSSPKFLIMSLVFKHVYTYQMSNTRSSRKSLPSSLKVQITINSTKIGPFAYQEADQVSKAFEDLQQLKIISSECSIASAKFNTFGDESIEHFYKFYIIANPKSHSCSLDIIVDPQYVNTEKVRQRASEIDRMDRTGHNSLDQSIKDNSRNGTFLALKRIFHLIKIQRYDTIGQLKEERKIDPVYVDIFLDYVDHVRKAEEAISIYDNIVKLVLNNDTVAEDFEQIQLTSKDDTKSLRDKDQTRIEQRLSQLATHKREEAKLFQAIKQQRDSLKEKNDELTDHVDATNQRAFLIESEKGQTQAELHQALAQLQISKAQIDDQQKLIKDLQKQMSLMDTQIQNKETTLKQMRLEVERSSIMVEDNLTQRDETISQLSQELKEKSKLLDTTLVPSQKWSLYQSYFMQKSQLLNSLCGTQGVTKRLISEIEKHSNQRKVSRFEQLYVNEHEKVGINDRFNAKVSKQPNHLLLARLTNGELFGAFSTAPFEAFKSKRRREKQSGFLFCLLQDQLLVWNLKQGHACVEYDTEFIIYGNQELCINRQTLQVEIADHQTPQQQRNFSSKNLPLHRILGDTGQRASRLEGFEYARVVFRDE